MAVVAASGSFAAISFIFGSALVGAVILIEAAGLDRRRLMVVLPVGLTAAGIGSLVSIGLGSWGGLSSEDFAIGALSLPSLARPDVADFAWTVPLAVVVAVVVYVVFRLARMAEPLLEGRPFTLLPAAGVAIAGLATVFEQTTDKPAAEVLFSGQEQLPGLIEGAGTWSVAALALLIAFKGVAWGISLGGFRGGPTFPGLYVGAASGVLASHLPGLALTPTVAVGMGAATGRRAAPALVGGPPRHGPDLRRGPGIEPLVIVGVVAAFLTTLALSGREAPQDGDAATGAPGDGHAPAAHARASKRVAGR